MNFPENLSISKKKLNSKKNHFRLIISLIISNLLSFITGLSFSSDNPPTQPSSVKKPIPHRASREKHTLITLPVTKFGAVAQFTPSAEGVEVVIQAPGGKILSISSFLVHLENFDESSETAYLEIPESDLAKLTSNEQLNLYYLWPARKSITPAKQEIIHELHF